MYKGRGRKYICKKIATDRELLTIHRKIPKIMLQGSLSESY